MSVAVSSPEMLDIIDPSSPLERLGSGFEFTEGPLWNTEGRFLLFTDIPADQIKRWSHKEGISDFRGPSGKANGLTYDKQRRLIACEHANRRVSRTQADGSVVVLASHHAGKRLNSPNDVVVKSDGSVYFTDPPYGLTKEYGVEGTQELEFQGVYRLSGDGKVLALLSDDFDRPNGLCFSPDEKLLYINDTARMHVRVFDVQSDGTLAGGRVFAKEQGETGAPDGMKVDESGNLYVTGPGGIWVFQPSGRHLGIIEVPERTANFTWGGDEGKSLFITATTSLYRIALKVRGIPIP